MNMTQQAVDDIREKLLFKLRAARTELREQRARWFDHHVRIGGLSEIHASYRATIAVHEEQVAYDKLWSDWIIFCMTHDLDPRAVAL